MFKTIALPDLKKKTFSITVKKPVLLPNGEQEVFNKELVFEKKEIKAVIQDPSFDIIALAMTEMMGMTGKLNLLGAGKVIFESCCIEYDEEIEKNVKYLAKLCLELASEYVTPAEEEIKKN